MSIKERIRFYLTGQRWTLGFINEPVDSIIKGGNYEVHYLKGQPSDRWFADPFILENNDDTVILLVEEFLYSTQLGRIAKLTINKKDYSLLRNETILELDTHLSFPAILHSFNNCYIYPENSDGKGLALYALNTDSSSCDYVRTISGLPLADAIITDLFGEKLMFATQKPSHNGNVLIVFKIDNDVPKEYAVCKFVSNIARNAGDWFRNGNDVIRPAQDCNEGYGSAVILQRVTKKSDTFEFEDLVRIESNNPKYNTGCHTFNHLKGMGVIDVHGFIHPRAAFLYSFIRKLI